MPPVFADGRNCPTGNGKLAQEWDQARCDKVVTVGAVARPGPLFVERRPQHIGQLLCQCTAHVIPGPLLNVAVIAHLHLHPPQLVLDDGPHGVNEGNRLVIVPPGIFNFPINGVPPCCFVRFLVRKRRLRHRSHHVVKLAKPRRVITRPRMTLDHVAGTIRP